MLFGWPRRVLSHCVQLMYDEVATILAVNLLNYKYRRARVQAIKSSSTWLYLAPPWTIIFVRLRGDEEETSGSCALVSIVANGTCSIPHYALTVLML